MPSVKMWTRALVSCLLVGGVSAQPVPAQGCLEAEPLWILLDRDGAATHVWFEREGPQLRMMRCATGTPACRVPMPNWRSLGGDVYGSESGMRLLPAWMVPTGGSRTGH